MPQTLIGMSHRQQAAHVNQRMCHNQKSNSISISTTATNK